MLILIALILLVIFLLPRYPEPRVISNFVSDEERLHIIKEAKSKLKPSTVAGNYTLDKKIRDSETAWLDPSDPIVGNVMNRCISLTDRPLLNCEKLQVLRYKPGGHYKPHQDAFGDTDPNKRMYTIIIALNDNYEGGETEFPNLNRKYKLRAGDVLFFDTLDNYELICARGIHGGLPVKSGEKWICNLWVHKYKYGN